MKLHIGCEQHYLRERGWTDCDLNPQAPHVVRVDARHRLPFDDESCTHVFHAHLLEHMSFREGCLFLGECFRVLRPGGRLRVTTPDLASLADMVLAPAAYQRYFDYQHKVDPTNVPFPTVAHVVNNFVRAWGHTFIHTEASLQTAMLAAGFRDLESFDCLESRDQDLQGLENVGRMPEGFYQLESQVFEGVRS
jgi:predicted SAM-dependent methyltransferase